MANERWIELNDFSPGIFADYHGGLGSSARGTVLHNGAATLENTYRCVADPNGGLLPLPARSTSSLAVASLNGTTAANYHPAQQGLFLLDAMIEQVAANTANVPARSATLYVLRTANISFTAGYPYFPVAVVTGAADAFSGSPGVADILWESAVDSWPYNTNPSGLALPGGSLAAYRSVTAAGSPPILASAMGGGMFGAIGMGVKHAAAAIPANEQAITTYDTSISTNYPTGISAGAYASGFGFAFPNPGVGNSPWIATAGAGNLPTGAHYALEHQGRMLLLCRTSLAGISSLGIFPRADFIWYTPPFDIKSLVYTTGTFFTQFTDDVAGIGAAVSVAEDELLLIRHSAGAVVVRGDLDNPTLVQLPYLEGTAGVTNVPIKTPIGLVYGSRNGVFVWAGGVNTRKISNQIEGFFWNVSNVAGEFCQGNRYRFGWMHPWVCVPNNFIFDTRTESWWVLEQQSVTTAPYSVYLTSPDDGSIVALPYKLPVATASAPAFDQYFPSVLAHSYSWQSQPIVESRDRLISVSQVEIVASCGANTNAGQTVSVTFTGYKYDGTPITPVTETFTLSGANGAQPQVLTNDIHSEINARYMQVRIQANGNGGVAPKVVAVRMWARDGNLPAKAAS